MVMIDEIYEFSAPRFYDFVRGETEEEIKKAELWFDTALTYAPSPFMQRIKTGRSVKLESLCDFSEDEHVQKTKESSDLACVSKSQSDTNNPESGLVALAERDSRSNQIDVIQSGKVDSEEGTRGNAHDKENQRSDFSGNVGTADDEKSKIEVCNTPKQPAATPRTRRGVLTESKKNNSANHTASLVRKPSAMKPTPKPTNLRKDNVLKKNPSGTSNFAHENQAIKRQKLEEGKSRQILNLKPPQPLPHKKSRLGATASSIGSSSMNKAQNKDRKLYVREIAASAPFVSAAEMMKKFHSSTRDLSLPHMDSSLSQENAAYAFQKKGKLTLTRPKEPELETSQRNRSVKIKSSAELEEEMMAKIPKFKARPLNKKILEAPTVPALPRSIPQPPEFQEFHLETLARAYQGSETASEISSDSHQLQNKEWKPLNLTTPRSPHLQTSMRARPPTVKSSWELEKEELENIPKFKARPLNKKIFESKGELGLLCHAKKEITIPQEFHFATDERISRPYVVVDLFDKLSLNSEPRRRENPKPKLTLPNPFHLHTEERGAEKEKKFVIEVVQKQIEEEIARVPKANPYPYTTDYPVVPPKPVPKPCTKPEPFQLESLMRHEEELQREREERDRMERKEDEMRRFKAQPVLKEDPVPVRDKPRIPLTQVQQFNLHADLRAVERAEFDKKVKEKEMMYKRYREETEAARMLEEERALKQLRRTLVPHARPVPSFDHPFCPAKSFKETTKAKSPKLRVLQRRKERHNKMMVNDATSSAASNMR